MDYVALLLCRSDTLGDSLDKLAPLQIQVLAPFILKLDKRL